MTDYFVSTDQKCKDYIAKMDSLMGYPNTATKTDTYAKPIRHEGNSGKYLVIIKEVWAPELGRQAFISDIDNNSTGTEISARKTHSVLKAEGAFPTSTE